MIEHVDNFYFDIAIHKFDEINFDKYFEGKHSLQEMAEGAFSSEYWNFLENLTPKSLNRMIKEAEEKRSGLEEVFDETGATRATVFAAAISYLLIIIVCGIKAIKSQEKLYFALFFGLAALSLLAIPIILNASKQILKAYHDARKASKIVNFLHCARRELLMTITPK